MRPLIPLGHLFAFAVFLTAIGFAQQQVDQGTSEPALAPLTVIEDPPPLHTLQEFERLLARLCPPGREVTDTQQRYPAKPWFDMREPPGDGVATPVLLERRLPTYTAAARSAKIQGAVILNITIRPDGFADDISVWRSLDPGLDVNAIECVHGWRFRPAHKDGKLVAFTARVIVGFELY